MVTRLYEVGLFRGSTIGNIVETQLVVLPRTGSADAGVSLTPSFQALESIFYTATRTQQQQQQQEKTQDDVAVLQLRHPLYMVLQEDDLDHVVATCWKHDSELGRGYILLSTAGGHGRIWRWETGGGPIAIGRTLSVERSGCRSEHYQSCPIVIDDGTDSSIENEKNSPPITTSIATATKLSYYGSGGIAIDSMSGSGSGTSSGSSGGSSEHFAEGKIVVAEWGEGRIARMEENGARTPLVIQVPAVDSCSDPGEVKTTATMTRRVHQPRALLFTPFGDLLFFNSNLRNADDENDSQSIDHGCEESLLRLRQSIDIEPLQSLQISRDAHSWTSIMRNTTSAASNGDSKQEVEQKREQLPEVIFHASNLGGMTLDSTWVGVYVTAKQRDGRVVLLSIPLGTEDDDEDEGDSEDCQAAQENSDAGYTCKKDRSSSSSTATTIILDYTSHTNLPGPVAVDREGNIFLGSDEGVIVAVNGVGPNSKSKNRGKNELKPRENEFEIVGTIRTPQRPVSLTIGEDGFLYIATETSLLRIRVQHGPVQIPTNLVLSKKR